MTRLQEAVILGLTLGVFHGMIQPAKFGTTGTDFAG